MRLAPLAVALALLAPLALAAPAHEHAMRYVVADDGPARFRQVAGQWVGINAVAFFPRDTDTRLTLRVDDASGASVAVGLCHEWTYDDGSHPTVTCLPRACAPLVDVALAPRPAGATYYRVLAFLFDEPHGCASRATVGVATATLS